MCYVNLWKEGIKMGKNILIMSLSNNLEKKQKKNTGGGIKNLI